jgi:hypothetical protein
MKLLESKELSIMQIRNIENMRQLLFANAFACEFTSLSFNNWRVFRRIMKIHHLC